MKKVYKVIFIIFIIVSMYSLAYNVSASNIWSDAGSFINQGASNSNNTIRNYFENLQSSTAKRKFEEVISVIWGLGLMVIFISTVVLGIRYMLVNPNEKSRIKQATTPYIIGVVVIFGAVTIWKLVIQILEG